MVNTERPRQLVFFGPPGTGKSYHINKICASHRTFRVTIHPEYTYSDFAGQLLPTSDVNGNVTFEFVAGPFTQSLAYAFTHRDEVVYLVLEELSRGNVAAIFGDLFQLLDRDSATGASAYPVHNSQIASYLPEIEENIAARTPDSIFLPANLSILASVNTSDQSVMPIDTAFKRRFDWEYVSTTPIYDTSDQSAYLNNPVIPLTHDATITSVTWVQLYQSINDYILDGHSPIGVNEDKQLGQFFISFDRADIVGSYSDDPDAYGRIHKMIANKLLMYLWEDVEGVNSVGSQRSERLFVPNARSFAELQSLFYSEQVFSDYFFERYLSQHTGHIA